MALQPVVYSGAGNAERQSTLDRELRDDFYAARAIVLYFGSPKQGGDYEDHWVLQEIRHIIGSSVPCLVYVSNDFPRAILAKHGYDQEPKIVSTNADFGTALQRDLSNLIT